jgi:CMP-N-acetylneuraminic acid synthetase
LLERGTRIGTSPLLYEMDPAEALDIDTMSDFRLAELRFTIEGEVSR